VSIYLDYSATTPPDARVRQSVQSFLQESWGNPSSLHSDGRRAKALLEDVRTQLSEQLGCQSSEVVFTAGGTEANNLAIIGAALANQVRGRHILISSMEHSSVLQAAKYLKSSGFEIELFDPLLPPEKLQMQLTAKRRQDTILLSMMYVNNETGIIFPLEEVAAFCNEHKILYHCDAVQAFGKIPFFPATLSADLLTISAHKIYGPAGVGALFIRKGVAVNPHSFGGGQEANRRAGTENMPGIAGFGAALGILDESLDFYNTAKRLQIKFEKQLKRELPDCLIIGKAFKRTPYISAVGFPGIQNETLLIRLDMAGIAASAGSACSSGSVQPSHVLKSMQLGDEVVGSVLRFSIGKFISEMEIDEAAERIVEIVRQL